MQEIARADIQRAAQGDLEAFEKIYRASSGFVYNVAFRLLHDPHDAEEITQDVFVTVYRKLKGFRYQSSLKTWIYRVTVNNAINHLKKKIKEREKRVPWEDNRVQHAQTDPFHETVDREHREHVIAGLLESLTPDQRTCLVLRDLEGLRYEEIAEILKINLNTVRTRIKRARERLLSLSQEVINDEV
jgi:RNA polymerase sigma-70 factor (ECF subfamily)